MRTILLSVFSLILCGCATKQLNSSLTDSDRLPSLESLTTETEFAGAQGSEHINHAPLNLSWWQALGDEVLTSLVSQGIENNKDLAQATLGIEQAMALAQVARARNRLQLDFSTTASRNRSNARAQVGQPRIQNQHTTGLDVGYEIDVFGGNAFAHQAAKIRVFSAQAHQAVVQVALVSQIAQSYLGFRGTHKQLKLLKENAQLQSETLALVKGKYRIGLTRALDVERAQAAYDTTLAQMPGLEARVSEHMHQLAALLGVSPTGLTDQLSDYQPLPIEPDQVPIGLPSDLVLRRADLLLAKYELEATFFDAKQATANRLPRFYLTGSPSLEARRLGDLLTSSAFNWNLGALLSWPIFQGGALKAQAEFFALEHRSQWLAYEQALLNAFAEVETSLVAYVQSLKTRAAFQRAEQSNAQAASRARGLFEQGLLDYLIVLETERDLIHTQNQLVASETQVLLGLVDLYQALGGGWFTPARK